MNPFNPLNFTPEAEIRITELKSEAGKYLVNNSPTIARARGGTEIETRDIETAYQNFIREQS